MPGFGECVVKKQYLLTGKTYLIFRYSRSKQFAPIFLCLKQ